MSSTGEAAVVTPTRLGAFAVKVAESGWLVALVAVPVFFNPHTVRVFEAEKVLLLRSVAVIIAVALLVWAIETGRSAVRVQLSLWRLPLAKPAVALAGAYLLSTAASIAPSISFWGAYFRCQGTYTWLSYMIVFVALVFFVRQRTQVERIVTAILLASIPPAVYAVLQHFGHDPFPWEADFALTERVIGMAGNPIFLSAYMIMVVPLTLVRVIEELTNLFDLSSQYPPGRYRLGSGIRLGAYLLLILLQLAAILYSQSRGPLLGLCAGLAFFSLVFGLQRGLRRLTLSAASVTVGGVLFLVLLSLPHTPLGALREAPYLGRLGRIVDVSSGQGSAMVRVLIWQGVTDLFAANPLRDLGGYGPETLFLAFPLYYPPELAHYGGGFTSPDRAHNETFDTLVTTGVIGFVAQLIVFVSLFFHALRWLGLLDTAGQRRACLCAGLLGGATGGMVPYFVDGSFRFSGVGLPVGIVAGLMVYLIAQALTRPRAWARDKGQSNLLLLGILTAVMGHFVEIQFGIAVATTRLYFWAYAALALAIGVPLVRPARQAPSGRSRNSPPTEPLLGGTVALSVAVALTLVILTFDFYRPSLDLRVHGPALAVLFSSVWLAGGLFAAMEPGSWRESLARLGGYAATTAGAWLLFAAIYKSWVDHSAPGALSDPLAIAVGRANATALLYVFVFSILGMAAVIWFLREPRPAGTAAPRGWRATVHLPLFIGALLVIVYTNLNGARADSLSKYGAFYESRRRWDAAAAVYEEAHRLRPGEARYAGSLARLLVGTARGDLRNRPRERDRCLARAVALLEQALRTSPLDPDHWRNLAATYRRWAKLSTDPAERRRHREQAEAYYEQAVALSPRNVALRNEWAILHLERSDSARALAILDESLRIDARFPPTHLARAKAHLAAGALKEALDDYERALAIDPALLPARKGKALVRKRLGGQVP